MFGDWYARNMYVEGSSQYLYHLRHYGHPSKFGYKDLVKLWKADAFDPESLMDLYVKAGARYFVVQAMHHDHFFNYPSKLNRFNAAEMGPQKDICGLWKKAADRHGLPFGLTEHLGATFSWWAVNKGTDKYGPYTDIPYDGNDPAYRDYYMDNYEHYAKDEDMREVKDWYTTNPKHHAYWLSVMKELIDLYTPDFLYTDGGLPFGFREAAPFVYTAPVTDPVYKYGLEAVAYLYNKSIEKYGENRALYTQKDRREEIYTIGVLDIEKSQLPGINLRPWHTDTCIGDWFYDVRNQFKRPGHIIEILVDVIAKNGAMLLNILQLPDGSIDEETRYILKELAAWITVCGEGVYGTRPWRVSGEGYSSVLITNSFKEEAVRWTETDFRFTSKGSKIYVFIMKQPESGVAVIRSFKGDEKVVSVKLLGSGPVPFSQNYGVLTVKLPAELPTAYTNCLAVELAD
jgi:alpha-L-fucosidase